MITQAQIDELRNNISDNDSPQTYSDSQLSDYISTYGTVDCASATIWKWKLGDIIKSRALSGLRSSSAGVESRTYETLRDQADQYRAMYIFYAQLCKDSQGAGTAYFVKTLSPQVAGILREDEDGELIDA